MKHEHDLEVLTYCIDKYMQNHPDIAAKYDFLKMSHFNNAIQNANVTFSMTDEHDVLKIADAPCRLVLVDQDTCDEKYIIEYPGICILYVDDGIC